MSLHEYDHQDLKKLNFLATVWHPSIWLKYSCRITVWWVIERGIRLCGETPCMTVQKRNKEVLTLVIWCRFACFSMLKSGAIFSKNKCPLCLFSSVRNYGLKAWITGKHNRLGFCPPPPEKKCGKVGSLSSPHVNVQHRWPNRFILKLSACSWSLKWPEHQRSASSQASLQDQQWGTPDWASC